MQTWSSPKRLSELATFYRQVFEKSETVNDAEFLQRIEQTFWPTNINAFIEQAFAIISPACVMRPHLTRSLIRHPIEAMLAGGIETPEHVISVGLTCAANPDPYVALTKDGRDWLLGEWPKLVALVAEVIEELNSESSKSEKN